MYIIEQVTGFSFAYDTNHLNWRIRNLGPHFGKGKGKATEASGSGAACASDDEGGDATTEDAPSPAAGPRCGCGSSHGHGAGGATRHALRQFFSYFCYTQKNTDKHLHRLEELANLPPSSPLHEFLDPYVEYDARHGTSASYEQGSRYDEGYAGQDNFSTQGGHRVLTYDSALVLPAGYSVEDTEMGATFNEIFGTADEITRTSTSTGASLGSASPYAPFTSCMGKFIDTDDSDNYEEF
jgi:hypothetical protein